MDLFIFEGNIPAGVSKNCLCVLNTSRLTVSPTSFSTRQEYSGDFFLNNGALPTLRRIPAEERHVRIQITK